MEPEPVSESPTEVGVTLQLPPVGGRFQPLAVLGEGGMAVVYRALDLETGEEVALKLPNLVGKYADRRFKQEGDALDAVRSPSIAGFVGRGTPDAPYIAMELVRGQTLARRIIGGGPMRAEATLAVGRRVAAALAVIHLQGWVHRDIKPGNIVLTVNGSARLVDFGLARNFEGTGAGTSTGQFVGTLGYLAPEQLSEGQVVDARCDVFALGCVLFEMITAQSAFRRSLESIFRGDWSKEKHPRLPTRTAAIPRPVGALIDRFTSIEPATRPRDGLGALAALLSLDPTFEGASIDEAGDAEEGERVRAILKASMRGPVVVTGAAGAGKSRAGLSAACYLAEIFAPCDVVALRGNPSVARVPGAHVAPLERALRAEGFTRAADVLRGDAHAVTARDDRDERADRVDQEERAFVLFVDDATLLDAVSIERVLRLAELELCRVVLTARPGGSLPTPVERVHIARAGTSTRRALEALSDAERSVLRAAAAFGTTFDARRVSMLQATRVEQTVVMTVADHLEHLVEKGVLARIGAAHYGFSQASSWERVVSAIDATELRANVMAAQRVDATLGPPEAAVTWCGRRSATCESAERAR